jgi:hypothetical protein
MLPCTTTLLHNNACYVIARSRLQHALSNQYMTFAVSTTVACQLTTRGDYAAHTLSISPNKRRLSRCYC